VPLPPCRTRIVVSPVSIVVSVNPANIGPPFQAARRKIQEKGRNKRHRDTETQRGAGDFNRWRRRRIRLPPGTTAVPARSSLKSRLLPLVLCARRAPSPRAGSVATVLHPVPLLSVPLSTRPFSPLVLCVSVPPVSCPRSLQVRRGEAVIAEGQGELATVMEIVFDDVRHGFPIAYHGGSAAPLLKLHIWWLTSHSFLPLRYPYLMDASRKLQRAAYGNVAKDDVPVP